MEVQTVRAIIKNALIVYIDSKIDQNSIIQKEQYSKYYHWAKHALNGDMLGYNFRSIMFLALYEKSKFNIKGFIEEGSLNNFYKAYSNYKEIINKFEIFQPYSGEDNFVLSKDLPCVLINPYVFVAAIADFIEWYEGNENSLTSSIRIINGELTRLLKLPNGPTIVTLCKLLHLSGISHKLNLHNDVRYIYVKNVCDHFNLQYRPRLAKGTWTTRDYITEQDFRKVKDEIYPLLDDITIIHIDECVKNKTIIFA